MTDDPAPSVAPPDDDPFVGHLAFLARHAARRATTLMDLITIEPIEPPGARVEDMLDFEALEAMASWQGLFLAPRDKRPGELDPVVEAQMKECLPQFHLRNIARYERHSDPDEDLELSHEQVPYGLRADGASTTRLARYEPIELLEEMNLDVIKGYQQRMRWLIRETAWSRHFCQELKDSVRGPLWRYDADAAEETPPTSLKAET